MKDFLQISKLVIWEQLIPYKTAAYLLEYTQIVERINWAREEKNYRVYGQYSLFAVFLLFGELYCIANYILKSDNLSYYNLSYYISYELLKSLQMDRIIYLLICALVHMTYVFYSEIYLNHHMFILEIFNSCLIKLENRLFHWPYKYKNISAPLFVRRVSLFFFNYTQIFVVLTGKLDKLLLSLFWVSLLKKKCQ